MSSEINQVKAIYSFKGKNNDELCFKKGDIITVTQREEGGWWEGTLGETTGWFPSNYVTESKESNGSVTTSPVRAPSEIQAFRNVVLKDIIDSEKAHVAELQGLVTNFLQPLEKSDILSRDEFRQLTGNVCEVLQTHEQLLALIEECGNKIGPEQRVGGLFLQWAPRLTAVHQIYCAGHPRAVCILDKYKDELNTFMEQCGAVCPGLLVLTAGLSKPFRRLGKYAAMLQELGRHVHEAHPDRGDTHRAQAVYKDMAMECSGLRRQKELELQVVTGAVRGWTGGDLSATLGEVLHMGGVAVGDAHADRYLVLFPTSLLVLSVSKRMSAFVYEGCLPLTGITVCKLEDTETRKNAFEITGPMIDTIIAVCQTRAEADNWVSLLQKHSNPNSTIGDGRQQPHSLPHSFRRSPSEGALSSFNSSRRSLYHVTLPPASYPPASPYNSLTKYFAELVRLRVITRPMLRTMLHDRPWAEEFHEKTVAMRRNHTMRLNLQVEEDGTIETGTDYSQSDTCESSSTNDIEEDRVPPVYPDHHLSSSGDGSCQSEFGYMRYYNNSLCDTDQESSHPYGDCTRDIFEKHESRNEIAQDYYRNPVISIKIDPLLQPSPVNTTSICKAFPKTLGDIKQYSETSDGSSFDCGKCQPYMACEDLVNIDQNMVIDSNCSSEKVNVTRHSCPADAVIEANTRQLESKKLWHSFNDSTGVITNEDLSARSSDLVDCLNKSPISKIVENLEPPIIYHKNEFNNSDLRPETIILEPPPMFQNTDDSSSLLRRSIETEHIPFRKHSINSDKKIRHTVSKSLTEHNARESQICRPSSNESRQCVSCHSDTNFENTCICCNRSRCHSPRSSDSGVAGSCNLPSPEYAHIPNDSPSFDNSSLTHSKNQIKSLNQITLADQRYTKELGRLGLTLSEIEADKYEEQCPCISPFGTPRTSCQPSLTMEHIVLGALDSPTTSVTSTYLQNMSLSSSQLWRSKPEVPPKIVAAILKNDSEKPILYRKPSKHTLEARNVRSPLGQSTPNIQNICHSKPSSHYHLRVYTKELFDDSMHQTQTIRPSRKTMSRNLERDSAMSSCASHCCHKREKRSRSEDYSKIQPQNGFMVYRSDLYAHWWMKAKLPITVSTDSEGHLLKTRVVLWNNDKFLGVRSKHEEFWMATDSTNSVTNFVTNHKRSHSFNNHHSYTPHSHPAGAQGALQSSCDSLLLSRTPSLVPKFSSVDFIDTSGLDNISTKAGWSITSLRPAPPLRCVAGGSAAGEEPRVPQQRRNTAYEEDALLLRVIETYCTTARCRNTLNSECDEDSLSTLEAFVRSPSLPINSNTHGSPSLWALVMRMHSDVKRLKFDVKQLQSQMQEQQFNSSTSQLHTTVQ